MKILQINKYHYLRGGSETVYFRTSELLEKHGHKVMHFATEHPENLPSSYSKFFPQVPEIRNLSVSQKIKSIGRFFYSRESARCLDRLLKEEKPDVAHLHNIFNGLSLSILPVLHKHGIPVVYTLHDSRLGCPSTDWMKYPERCNKCRSRLYLPCAIHNCYEESRVLSAMMTMEMIFKEFLFNYDKYIDRYIFVSEIYQRLLSRDHPYLLEENKGRLLHNFTPITEPVQNTGNYLLAFGRIRKDKGFVDVVKAAALMPDIEVRIAGTGPEYEELRSISTPNVKWLGFQTGETLQRTIAEAKAIMVPSIYLDNNPMTVLESAMLGRPVIGTRIGGIPEIIRDGDTGWLVEPGNIEQLAEAMRKAWNLQGEEYERMRQGARDFAIHNLSPESYYPRLLAIYNEAIAAHSRS